VILGERAAVPVGTQAVAEVATQADWTAAAGCAAAEPVVIPVAVAARALMPAQVAIQVD
jgi:hypothetical protein